MSQDVSTAVSAGAITTDKRTYRRYALLDTDGKVSKTQVQAEVANQVNWKKLEKEGYQQVSENDIIFYNLTDMAAFSTLIPSPERQLQIVQAGLNYVQNAKANAAMKADKEGQDDVPENEGVTIDLRDALNELTTKRSLTDIEKIMKLLDSIGVTGAKREAMLAAMMAEEPATEEAPAQ